MRTLKTPHAAAAAVVALAVGMPLHAAAQRAEAGAAVIRSSADTTDRTYWQSTRDGWFWYQDPAVERATTPVKPATPSTPELDRDLAGMKRFKERVQQSLDAAVWNPSPQNIAMFLELQAESRRKASAFTDLTRVVSARMPWLSADADGARPANPVAASSFDAAQREQREALIHSLAQTHGLYFFFRSDCRYCHAFAPLLKQFERKYGLTVFAISLDGGPIPHFPNAVTDNGTFMRILVDADIPPDKVQVPFTALASPRTREVMPVGFGVMSADELAERIELVAMNQQAAQAANGRALPGALASNSRR